MKNNVIKGLVLFFLSIGTCYAEWTKIITPARDAVQCDNRGWIEGKTETTWSGTCHPLSVRHSETLKVYSVSTFESCKDDELSLYTFKHEDNAIKLVGCFTKHNQSVDK